MKEIIPQEFNFISEADRIDNRTLKATSSQKYQSLVNFNFSIINLIKLVRTMKSEGNRLPTSKFLDQSSNGPQFRGEWEKEEDKFWQKNESFGQQIREKQEKPNGIEGERVKLMEVLVAFQISFNILHYEFEQLEDQEIFWQRRILEKKQMTKVPVSTASPSFPKSQAIIDREKALKQKNNHFQNINNKEGLNPFLILEDAFSSHFLPYLYQNNIGLGPKLAQDSVAGDIKEAVITFTESVGGQSEEENISSICESFCLQKRSSADQTCPQKDEYIKDQAIIKLPKNFEKTITNEKIQNDNKEINIVINPSGKIDKEALEKNNMARNKMVVRRKLSLYSIPVVKLSDHFAVKLLQKSEKTKLKLPRIVDESRLKRKKNTLSQKRSAAKNYGISLPAIQIFS